MSETNQRRSLPSLDTAEESSLRDSLESGNQRLVGLPAIIAQAIEVFGTKERESRTKESFDNIKTLRSVNQNERLAIALSGIQRNQEKSVGLLDELLKVVKGQQTNRQNLNFIDNLFSSLPFRFLLRATGILIAGGSVALAMRALLGSEEEIREREEIVEQQRNEVRRQGDALVPRPGTADELQPTIDEIVANSETEEEVINKARMFAYGRGSDVDTDEHQYIVATAVESFRQRQGGGTPTQTAEQPLPVPPIPPATVPPEEPPLPVPPIPPATVPPVTPQRGVNSNSPVPTEEEATKAGVLDQSGKVIPLPPNESVPIPVPQRTRNIPNLALPASSTIVVDNTAKQQATAVPKAVTEITLEKIIRQREDLATTVENNPDLFSNRILNLRARKISFKGDEIEFVNSGTVTPNSPNVGGDISGGAVNPAASIAGALPRALGGAATQTPNGGGQTGENGRLPDSELRPIGFGRHRLRTEAAEAYMQMVQAAAADGVTWTVTDSYRTYDQQVQLVREKGLYSQGGLAAVPGRSNHGWGLAVDLGGGVNREGTPQNRWLQENAGRFGFSTIPREPWHWEFRGGATQQRPTGQTPGAAPTEDGGSATPITPGGDAIPTSSTPMSGQQVAAASEENAIADRTPAPPSVTAVGGEGTTPQGPNPSVGPPNYFSSPNDPGNVEPADAAERYARLFNMAA